MHANTDTEGRLSADLEALRRATEDRLPSLADAERTLHARLRSAPRRRLIAVGAIAAACSTALAAPLLRGPSAPREHDAATPPSAAAPAVDARPAAPAAVGSALPTTKDARARRDALRREIARHAPASTDLKNKLGPAREPLVAYLNEELSPLLADCVEQARARTPGFAGLFAVSIETLADAELGAVVEAAEPSPRNELADPLFFECVRESAFTLTIPPPLTSGQEQLEVNGYFGEAP